MITESDFTDSMRALYELMSDISEACWCAGWMADNEFRIWEALQSADKLYGLPSDIQDDIRTCGKLSDEIGGWIIWVADGHADNWGPRFIIMPEWFEMVRVRERMRNY